MGTYFVVVDSGTSNHAFVWEEGHFTTLDPPGATRSQGGFINAKGEAVGTYRDEDQKRHGFIWRKGVFTSFNVPGDGPDPSGTVAFGINDIGEVVGTYVGPSLDPQMIQGMHGFVRSRNGDFTTIDLGAKTNTQINSINAKGEIVGFYVDSNNKQHGFLGTPAR
jgi:uncharacterized membrane protein